MYEGMDFSGNVFVQTSNDDDLIGFAFAYQSTGRFYLVSWKQASQGYWRSYKGRKIDATAGVELKVGLIYVLLLSLKCYGTRLRTRTSLSIMETPVGTPSFLFNEFKQVDSMRFFLPKFHVASVYRRTMAPSTKDSFRSLLP